jgi:hypothetical protein
MAQQFKWGLDPALMQFDSAVCGMPLNLGSALCRIWMYHVYIFNNTRQRTQLSRVRIRLPHSHLNGARIFDCASYKTSAITRESQTRHQWQ